MSDKNIHEIPQQEHSISAKIEKSLPQQIQNAITAEKLFFSSLLQDPSTHIYLADELGLLSEHFILNTHQNLYGIIHDSVCAGEEVNRRYLIHKVSTLNFTEDIGSSSTIKEIYELKSSLDEFTTLLRAIQGYFMARELINICLDVEFDRGRNVEHFSSDVIGMGHRLQDVLSNVKSSSIKDDVNLVMEQFLDHMNGEKTPSGYSTGFTGLDDFNCRFQPGQLFVFATCDDIRKTSFALNIVEETCLNSSLPTLLCSCESKSDRLVSRLVYSTARCPTPLGDKVLTKYDVERVKCAGQKILDSDLFIDDSAEITVNQLRSKIRRLKSEENIQIVVIDYSLGLIDLGIDILSLGADERVALVLSSLNQIARELAIPIVIIYGEGNSNDHKLNVSNFHRFQSNYHRFQSNWLREEVDHFCLLRKVSDKEYYDEIEYYDEEDCMIELHVIKNTDGHTGCIPLVHIREMEAFENSALKYHLKD